jgi:hypothetical protein
MLAADSRPLLLVPSPSASAGPSERSRHSRKVTRDIAALDFLQSIPMRSESASEPPDVEQQSAAESALNATASATSAATQAAASDPEPLAGRRLPGMAATVVHVPPLFRYRFTTKFPAASAVVRRWEGVTAQQGLLDARLFFSRGCGYPLATSTIINVQNCRSLHLAHALY